MRGLGAAVALAGGPFGLLLGILGGTVAAMVLFRDTTETAAPIMDEAADAMGRINEVLATSSESLLPAAQRETLNLTNENIKLAKSAYAAAEAELAKAKAAAQYAQTELGLQQAFSPTGEFTQAESDLSTAMGNLTRAQSQLLIQQDGLTSRINEGQLALSRASDAMAENQSRTIDLSVTMDDLAGAASNGGGSGGAAGAVRDVSDALKEAEQAQKQWAQNMAGHFDGLITGGKNLSGVLMSMGRQLESRGWQMLFSGLGGGASGGGFFGSLFKGIGSLFSFDGGGYTGSGARSGGLDGKGGFLAMMHPQETVIDHTKGQSMGGAQQITLRLITDAGVTVQQVGQIATGVAVQVVREGLGQNRKALPSQIDTLSARGV
jgi:hypothetical protein